MNDAAIAFQASATYLRPAFCDAFLALAAGMFGPAINWQRNLHSADCDNWLQRLWLRPAKVLFLTNQPPKCLSLSARQLSPKRLRPTFRQILQRP